MWIATSGRALLPAVLVLTLVLSGCGGSDGGGESGGAVATTPAATTPAATTPASTANVYKAAPVGTPTGTPVTNQIGPAGGSVTSSDGRLTLDIPTGALAAPTDVTIQPITDTTPGGGIGSGYRLEPDGLTSPVPITLTFHVSEAEALALGSILVVTQHADGFWYAKAGVVRDPVSRALSVTTTHFSDWAVLRTLWLEPQSAQVRTSHTADFVPKVYVDGDTFEELVEELGLRFHPDEEVIVMEPQVLDHQLRTEASRHWSVNGVTGGAPTEGTIVQQGLNGHFTAPPAPPSPSTVMVSLDVELASGTKVVAVAPVDIDGLEYWDGHSDLTYIDGTKIIANWAFAQIGDATDGRFDFDVADGTIDFVPLQVTSEGCPLDVAPRTHLISPGEGSLTVSYALGDGGTLDAPVLLKGGGATVWAATYTTHCPLGPKDIPGTAGGPWFPGLRAPVTTDVSSSSATTPSVDIPIASGGYTGTVHLQKRP